ncbi:MAG: PocR ligand-binding domain-containing protein [Clostridia bacterium]|nr:PocR ligand-binding domain-containing protein [Clostridia bacterium]
MKRYIFDKEKIEESISDFYAATGIATVLYDADGETVAASRAYTKYCAAIRKNDGCALECSRSNYVHMDEAKRTGETVFYTCHAGIMEAIKPIFYEDTLIAYLQIGQFRDGAGRYSNEKNVEGKIALYGLDKKEMLPLYREIPIVSSEKLQALQNLMNTMVKSFWGDGLIRSKRSMLSVKIEQYIKEHIEEKIYVEELCKAFFLSKNALYALFEREFQSTVNEFILSERMKSAKRLLKETNLPLAEIAAACGFDDYNYFIRIFKKKSGVPPLQYKKMQK